MREVRLYLENGHSSGRVATSGYRHGRQKPKLQIKTVANPATITNCSALLARSLTGAFVGLIEHKDCSDFAIKVDLQLAMLRRENDLVDEGADGFEGRD